LGFENVRLEAIQVPHWVRGPIEEAAVVGTQGQAAVPLRICALGGSVATPEEGITAPVLEVRSFEELRAAGEKAKGRIIFFNRPFDRGLINPFHAYGGAVDQRSVGAIEAARAGGKAALVRSMTTALDDSPHTGAMYYNDTVPKVPAAAVSTRGAETLSQLLAGDPDLKLRIKLTCQTLPDVESANVVGELVGSEKPKEIVLIGGHLDSWDKGQGAHDDGAGCIHAIEAVRLLKQLGFRPKRTIRAVLFMNEENGLRGGQGYADRSRPGERHVIAIESDMGGFAPRGFDVGADATTFPKVARWAYLFEPIEADRFHKGGGAGDISALARKGVPCVGLRLAGQRYFDYHHSENDTIDKVNQRELELGAAAMAVLAYVMAEEGVSDADSEAPTAP
jgi:Zn-dependent M28 family amino/carboxypeptidase